MLIKHYSYPLSYLAHQLRRHKLGDLEGAAAARAAPRRKKAPQRNAKTPPPGERARRPSPMPILRRYGRGEVIVVADFTTAILCGSQTTSPIRNCLP